ncbi:uncharacterized protein [Desmodus rotundus]
MSGPSSGEGRAVGRRKRRRRRRPLLSL